MFVLELHFEHRVGQRFDDRGHDFDRLFLAHRAAPARAGRSPAAAADAPVPRTTAPRGSSTTVNSKCADALPSRVRTVQPSLSTLTSARPRLNIGSIAMTIPAFSTAPRPAGP